MSNLPSLPPGFRFHPTDEELILCYLSQKLLNSSSYSLSIIPEVEIYKFDPWDLPEKAAFGEKEWYFFSHRDRKYPNGARPNRAAASGYWKATGTDKHILATSTNTSNKYNLLGKRHGIIGVKKSLVFYKGRPPKGLKTCWIMHEYRLFQPYSSYYKPNAMKLQLQADSSKNKLDDCVLCRIYKKPKSPATTMDEKQEELLPNLPTTPTHKPQKSSSFSELFNALDYSLLTPFQSDDHPIDQSDGFELNTPLMIGNNNNYSSSSSSYSTLESRGGSDHNQQLIKRQYATEASLPTSNINNPWNNYSDQHGLLNQPFLNQYSHSPQFQR